MKKFRIPYTVTCIVYVEIEAETKEDAIENGFNEAQLSQFVGNGGHDKIIGVYGSHLSVEANDDYEVDEEGIEEIS
ncbi:hypothetical protein HZP59_08780 [Elizabethkingia anophelis]|nr:hypothetical protein [Elizabethkingia anophelis]